MLLADSVVASIRFSALETILEACAQNRLLLSASSRSAPIEETISRAGIYHVVCLSIFLVRSSTNQD